MSVKFQMLGWDAAELFISGLPEDLRIGLRGAVEDVSKEVQSRIQERMPVDTGWAQARWGEEMYGGFWEVREDGLEIWQGSEIEPYEYIEKLNEGSSVQAPAGFIDAEAERGALLLVDKAEVAITKAADN